MKALSMTTLVGIIILIVVLYIVVVVADIMRGGLGNISYWEKTVQASAEMQGQELLELYNKYYNNDGGFDAYEASIILAKAIEFTWRDCYNICRGDKELFTNFFAEHPIEFSKDMDCSKYPTGDDYPDIGRIQIEKAKCHKSKSSTVDEWTVTAWGLKANTEMCENYKLKDGKNWGNYKCSGDITADKCDDFCDVSNANKDYIEWEGKEMKKGNSYSDIVIKYSPAKGIIFKSEPKIIVEVNE